MRRFQMLIEADLYEALVRRSWEEDERASAAGLLRRFARERFESDAQSEDPLSADPYLGPVRHREEAIDGTVYRPSPR